MIVRSREGVAGSERDIQAATWESQRLLLKKDGLGFSLHYTVIKPGTEMSMWYKNHYEAVYCIQGEGELELTETGRVFALKPGVMYAVNEHQRHRLRAHTELHFVCVFNPPCTGAEIHDADGSYPLLEAE